MRHDNKKISRKHKDVIYKITFMLSNKFKSVKFAAKDGEPINSLINIGKSLLDKNDGRILQVSTVKKRYVSSKKTNTFIEV